MKRVLFAFLLLTGMQGMAQDCSNLYVELSSDGSYIYFASNRSGNYDIYRAKPDGTELTQLTDSTLNESFPSISPDGSKILYQLDDYGKGSVWVMNSDGSNKMALTDGMRHAGYPNWSPDGSRIVYEGWDGSNYPEVFIMDADGSNKSQLTSQTGAYWNSAPLFNPSGNKIYFLKGFNADNYIASMNPDGSGVDTITPPNSFGYGEFGLHFSFDGNKIIFATTEWKGYNNGSDIVIANPDGSNWRRLSNAANKEYFYEPTFMQDTNAVMYSWSPNANTTGFQIFTADRELNNQQQITNCNLASIHGLEFDFSVYPSPADKSLFLEIPQNANYFLLDASGRIFSSSTGSKSETGTISIDVSHFPSGMYVLQVLLDGHQMNRKILIAHP